MSDDKTYFPGQMKALQIVSYAVIGSDESIKSYEGEYDENSYSALHHSVKIAQKIGSDFAQGGVQELHVYNQKQRSISVERGEEWLHCVASTRANLREIRLYV